MAGVEAQRPSVITPADAACFIGFHDIVPWSHDNNKVLLHRMPRGFTEMDQTANPIEICLWSPEEQTFESLAETRAWNFQQGARLQWLPGSKDVLVYNAIEDGRLIAVLHDLSSGAKRSLDGGIYGFSPDGAYSISPDFNILSDLWPAYGYLALSGGGAGDPETSGLWLTDVVTGERSLLVSTARASQLGASETAASGSGHFLAHPSFSPDGSRICFLHRFFSADGALYTRMIVTDRDARHMTLLAEEKVSHFDWFNNDELLVWARFAGKGLAKARSSGLLNNPLIYPLVAMARKITGRWKRGLLSEAFYKLPVNGDPKTRYGWPRLDNDGHPMFARSHDWILLDTYPHNGVYPIVLYNQTTGERVDPAVFDYGVTSSDTDAKCDLHPRWDRTETRIAVDTCEKGVRRVQLIDVSDIVGSGR